MNHEAAFENLTRLLEILSDPEQMRRYEATLKARREARKARRDAKWQRWLDQMTLAQEALVAQYRQDGALPNKMFRNRDSGHIAMMLVKQSWDHARGRMGRKIIMVYPDGSRTETLEKTISVKQHF